MRTWRNSASALSAPLHTRKCQTVLMNTGRQRSIFRAPVRERYILNLPITEKIEDVAVKIPVAIERNTAFVLSGRLLLRQNRANLG